MSQQADRNAAHCLDRLLQPQRCFASRWRGTRLRRAVDPGDLCQPSGPDGEGQARGQARKARGGPQRLLGDGRTPSQAKLYGHAEFFAMLRLWLLVKLRMMNRFGLNCKKR